MLKEDKTLLLFLHVMVEELLQLFITKIDANLFECVKFEDFESSNVEDADEVHFLGSLDCVIWIICICNIWIKYG